MPSALRLNRRRKPRSDGRHLQPLMGTSRSSKIVDGNGRLVEHPVSPLLVFSRAYLDRPVSRRRGVVVLPARMLERHLARRDAILARSELVMLQAHVVAVLARANGSAAS
jgi:hypothetical protein